MGFISETKGTLAIWRHHALSPPLQVELGLGDGVGRTLDKKKDPIGNPGTWRKAGTMMHVVDCFPSYA